MSKAKLNFKLKWTPDDPSTAIMLTFSGDAQEPLLEGKLEVLFRKMGPQSFKPTLVYAYVSAPASAIVAKFEVDSWEREPVDVAISLASKGLVSEDYLRSYSKGYSDLLVIKPGPIQVADTPITLKQMSNAYEFWPSSTFMPLSANGIQTLNRLGNFRAPNLVKSKAK